MVRKYLYEEVLKILAILVRCPDYKTNIFFEVQFTSLYGNAGSSVKFDDFLTLSIIRKSYGPYTHPDVYIL